MGPQLGFVAESSGLCRTYPPFPYLGTVESRLPYGLVEEQVYLASRSLPLAFFTFVRLRNRNFCYFLRLLSSSKRTRYRFAYLVQLYLHRYHIHPRLFPSLSSASTFLYEI